MRFKDKLKTTIYKENVYNPSSGYGIINAINADNYTADVIIINNNNPALGHLEKNLPLPMINGLSYSLPHIGDRVMLNFIGVGETMPVIAAVYPTNLQKLSLSRVESSNLRLYDGLN